MNQYVFVIRSRDDDSLMQVVGPFDERQVIALDEGYYGTWITLDAAPWDWLSA